ncbi:Unknown protein sequence [Pseudomonas amygdali pv. lachrymans]|uniref:Uncharacterized protein n=1 Tax=Pseudomonas amygdali pv. lachrymans TaxID=53707 RepID=A0ABR5KSF3_PSEAV|nr:Unknown protein sequence [Pseudomonas amygdali pv. lachrymans]
MALLLADGHCIAAVRRDQVADIDVVVIWLPFAGIRWDCMNVDVEDALKQ